MSPRNPNHLDLKAHGILHKRIAWLKLLQILEAPSEHPRFGAVTTSDCQFVCPQPISQFAYEVLVVDYVLRSWTRQFRHPAAVKIVN